MRGDEVWLLRRALYGLRAAPAKWSDTLATKFLEWGLKETSERTLWSLPSSHLFIAAYVDDILAVGKEDALRWFEERLREAFEIRSIPTAAEFTYLGLRIVRRPGVLELSAPRAISKLKVEGNMEFVRSAKAPCEKDMRLPKQSVSETSSEHLNYRACVGICQWLAGTCRPDISWTVRELAVHSNRPGPPHVQALKHLM